MLIVSDNKLDGENIRVQTYETAICNIVSISYPSNIMYDRPDIQWVVGAVVKGKCNIFVRRTL